jgi:hypothetical protein
VQTGPPGDRDIHLPSDMQRAYGTNRTALTSVSHGNARALRITTIMMFAGFFTFATTACESTSVVDLGCDALMTLIVDGQVFSGGDIVLTPDSRDF